MRCLIIGCLHTISRGARMQLASNSWGKWQICLCCAISLDLIVSNLQARKMACKYLLLKELTPKKEPDLELIQQNKAKKKARAGDKFHEMHVGVKNL